MNSATGSNRSRFSLRAAAPSKSRPMENCSIPSSSPAIGPISMPWSRRSKSSNKPATSSVVRCWALATTEPVPSEGGSDARHGGARPRRRRVGRSPRRSPSAAEAGWTFPFSRRVKGAWWPSRSSKPLSVRKSRGRFDSCPLRESSTIEAAVSAASSRRRACLYRSVERR